MIAKPPIGSILHPGRPLARGLMLCCPLDEGSGTTFRDLVSHDVSAFDPGNEPSWTQGAFGRTLGFPIATRATAGFAAAPYNRIGLNDWSGSVWFSITTIQAIQNFFTAGSLTVEDQGWHFRYGSSGGGKFTLSFSNGTSRQQPASAENLALSEGVWHHAAFTADRDSVVTFYLDGRQVGTVSISAYAGWDIQGTNSILFSSTSSTFDLIGAIDAPAVWRRVLTPDEVRELYRDPFTLSRRPRIELWTAALGATGGATYNETVSAAADAQASATDTASVAAAVTAAAGVAASATDTAAFVEAVAAQATLAASATDSMVPTEIVSAAASVAASATDALTVIEQPTAQADLGVAAADAAVFVEIVGAAADLAASAADNTAPTEVVSAVAGGAASCSDSLIASEPVSAAVETAALAVDVAAYVEPVTATALAVATTADVGLFVETPSASLDLGASAVDRLDTASLALITGFFLIQKTR